MKFRLTALLFPLLLPLFPAAGQDGLDLSWTEVEKNAQYAVVHKEIFGQMRHVAVFRYKSSKYFTDIINDPGVKSGTVSMFADRYNVISAINGSYFNVKALTPVTYVKEDKVQEGYTTPREFSSRVDGVLAAGSHRVKIDLADTVQCVRVARSFDDALAAGPVLLKNYRTQPLKEGKFYEGFHPRTFVGTTRDGWVYMVVVDGRFPEAKGMTIEQTAKLAQMLGLKDAINLDGGGSSTLWVKGAGVISHPYDNKKFDHEGERTVPNVVIVRKW